MQNQVVTGAGMTWVAASPPVVVRNVNPQRGFQVFVATADENATPGALTIGTDGTGLFSRGWIVVEIDGCELPVANVVTVPLQSGATSLQLAFQSPFADPANIALAFVMTSATDALAQDAGDPDQWTLVHNQLNVPPSSVWSLGIWVHEGETGGMTATWPNATEAGGLAFELPATGGGTPPTFNPAWAARSTVTLQPGRAA